MSTNSDSEQSGSEWWLDPSNIQTIRHYAHLSGLLYRPPPGTLSDNTAVNIAVTLQPRKFPKELFELVWDVQPDLNSLVDSVSRDLGFLQEALRR